MTKEELIKTKNEYYQYFDEQSAMEAVKKNGYALRYVKEQTEAVCLEAVKEDGDALCYVNELRLSDEG